MPSTTIRSVLCKIRRVNVRQRSAWPSTATAEPHFETRRLVEAIRFDFSERGETVNDVFRQLALPGVNWHVGLPLANLLSEFTYFVDGINSVISEAIGSVRDA